MPEIAQLVGRHAEVPAEYTIEVGKVAKSDIEGDVGDAPVVEARADEHAACPHKPLVAHERREGGSFGLEQRLYVARRQPVLRRDRIDRRTALETLDDIFLDSVQPRGAHAAFSGKLKAIRAGAERDGEQIVHM